MNQEAKQKTNDFKVTEQRAADAKRRKIEAESKNISAGSLNVTNERLLWVTPEQLTDPENRAIIAKAKMQFKLRVESKNNIDRCKKAFTLADFLQSCSLNNSVLEPLRLLASKDLTPKELEVWETRHTLQALLPPETKIKIVLQSAGRASYCKERITVPRSFLSNKLEFASHLFRLIGLAQCGKDVLTNEYESCLVRLLGQVALAKLESHVTHCQVRDFDFEARPTTLEELAICQEANVELKLQNAKLNEMLKQQKYELDELNVKLEKHQICVAPDQLQLPASLTPHAACSSSSSSRCVFSAN
jgi:hypothetical protein